MNFEIDDIGEFGEFEEGLYNKLAKAIAKRNDIEFAKIPLADLIDGYVKCENMKFILKEVVKRKREDMKELEHKSMAFHYSNGREVLAKELLKKLEN